MSGLCLPYRAAISDLILGVNRSKRCKLTNGLLRQQALKSELHVHREGTAHQSSASPPTGFRFQSLAWWTWRLLGNGSPNRMGTRTQCSASWVLARSPCRSTSLDTHPRWSIPSVISSSSLTRCPSTSVTSSMRGWFLGRLRRSGICRVVQVQELLRRGPLCGRSQHHRSDQPGRAHLRQWKPSPSAADQGSSLPGP